VLWLAGLAWLRPLAVPDEGRYTDIARWMVLSGDWLIPRLNGLPFIQKPPLYFWLEAAGIGLAGSSVLVARWVSLAAALATGYVVHRFVRARFDADAARWSTIVLLTSPLFFSTAQFASLDMLVSTCITCTILFAIEAAEAPADHGRRFWLAAYATAALGVLAKGLIGIVIPALVFSLWAIALRRPRLLLHAVQLRGLLLFAAMTVPWFVLVERRVPGFLHYFFIHNHFERYAAGGFNNPRGPWFYFALVFGGMLPWSVAAFHASRSALTRSATGRAAALLGLISSMTVIVFFTIPTSKLAGYVLPALPALAIVLGPWCARWKYRRPAAIVGVLLCIAVIPLALRAKGLDPGRLAAALRPQVQVDDRVVFWGRYFFSVPVILQRTRPVEVVDAWTTPSVNLPDTWRRELAAGREFEPASGAGVLLTPGEFQESLARHPGRVWVWVHQDDAKALQLAGFVAVLARGEYVVLQRASP
jgi:4-amino-4-deoxy-L-arabinose transferase-like glycosyltransferase